MEKELNRDNKGEQKEQKNTDVNSVLDGEIYRAVQMMKRVKKSNAVQFENTTESQRMPSYAGRANVISGV